MGHITHFYQQAGPGINLCCFELRLTDGDYAQATATGSNNNSFAFYYYNLDHLGNVREVVDASAHTGTVK